MFFDSLALTNILLAFIAVLNTAICVALWRILYSRQSDDRLRLVLAGRDANIDHVHGSAGS